MRAVGIGNEAMGVKGSVRTPAAGCRGALPWVSVLARQLGSCALPFTCPGTPVHISTPHKPRGQRTPLWQHWRQTPCFHCSEVTDGLLYCCPL